MELLRLDVRGMMCDHCVEAVTKALGQVPGVRVGQVLLGSAELEYDPRCTTEQQIMDSVSGDGYEARRA